jgi:hypothetical protein
MTKCVVTRIHTQECRNVKQKLGVDKKKLDKLTKLARVDKNER